MELEYAKSIMLAEGCSCVLVKGNQILKSNERGVKPLMNWLERGLDLTGFCAADKVIGKATAFLYVYLGVREVYGNIISRQAVEVLSKYGVALSCGQVVDAVLNRKGDGFCPMETAVWDIFELDAAIAAITDRFQKMNQ